MGDLIKFPPGGTTAPPIDAEAALQHLAAIQAQLRAIGSVASHAAIAELEAGDDADQNHVATLEAVVNIVSNERALLALRDLLKGARDGR